MRSFGAYASTSFPTALRESKSANLWRFDGADGNLGRDSDDRPFEARDDDPANRVLAQPETPLCERFADHRYARSRCVIRVRQVPPTPQWDVQRGEETSCHEMDDRLRSRQRVHPRLLA